jgi:hypothetical protein
MRAPFAPNRAATWREYQVAKALLEEYAEPRAGLRSAVGARRELRAEASRVGQRKAEGALGKKEPGVEFERLVTEFLSSAASSSATSP